MERLAYKLWADEVKQLNYQAIEDWLIDQVLADRRWEAQYQAYMNKEDRLDILQHDLRNASFIVHSNENSFRFAHTSIMEYFLARALHRALIETKPEAWAIRKPSAETLDFLGELITVRATQPCLQTLALLRASYRKQASELTLHYALRACQQGWPGAEFAGFQLQGADFNGLEIQAKKGATLNWRGADFSQATLMNGEFKRLDLTGAKFNQTDLSRSLFDQCNLAGVEARKCDLTGTKLHHCNAAAADFDQAQLYHTHWLPSENCPDIPQGFENHHPPRIIHAESNLD